VHSITKLLLQIEEGWEFQAVITKNNATFDALLIGKYKFLYFLDDPDGENETTEVCRVVDIEWQLRRGTGSVSRYNIVTQLVFRNEEIVVVGDDDYVPYEINDALHNMIRGAGQHNVNHVMLQKE
jgi:hypothetical protein